MVISRTHFIYICCDKNMVILRTHFLYVCCDKNMVNARTHFLYVCCDNFIVWYRSPNIVRVIKSRRLRWAGHVAGMEEGRSAFKILIDKATGKRPVGRSRCR